MSATRHPCIRCDHCAPVCPAGLQPQQLYFFGHNQLHEEAAARRLFDCTECGACQTVCPSLLPLVDTFRHSKAVISAQQEADAVADAWRQRFERHQVRREWDRVRQNERKLEKLQNKLTDLAEGRAVSRDQQPASAAAATPDVAPPIANKSSAQIKADIEAAVARARAKKVASQGKNDPQDLQS